MATEIEHLEQGIRDVIAQKRSLEAENARLRREQDALGALAEHATRRETELEAALRALLEIDPLYTDYAYGGDALRCIACAGQERVGVGFVHLTRCPREKARALVEREGGG
jgi:hypothetical protein